MPHQLFDAADSIGPRPECQRALRRRLPRQQRSNNTVSLILQAAEELFSAKGFKNTKSEDIVRRAGFGIASLYDYFPNKISIARALLEIKSIEITEDAEKIFAKASTEPIEISLPRIARELFYCYRSNRWIFVNLVNEVPELREFVDLYSIDKLIYKSSLNYLRLYESELGSRRLSISHEFLYFLFASTVRQYLSSADHQMDDETFIKHLSIAVLAYVTY